MDPKDKALLDGLGRPGWTIVSKQPSTDYTAGTYPGERVLKYPEGSETWIITDGKGHNQQMVVKPPSAYPGPYSSNVNDPGSFNPNPTVIEPPPDLPASATATPTKRTQSFGGVVYEEDPTAPGGWRKVDVPGNAPTSSATHQPSTPEDWKPLKDDSGRTVALLNTKTGDTQAVSQPAQDKNATAGATKDTFDNGRQITWQADGQGNWTIKTIGQPLQDTTKPKEGDKRQAVRSGMAVTEVYRGGEWVVDPSVAPTQFDPSKGKEGDEYQAIEDGYNVTRTFRGGQWVTTKIGDRATPQTPTTINTGTSPYIVQQTPGQPGFQTSPNPNTTDVAARVQQLQTQAQAKRDELNKAIASGSKTKEEAAAEFDTWWATNVVPQQQQLQQAQQQQTTDATIKQNAEIRAQAAAEQSAFSTAQQAGQNAVSNAQAGLANRVGPGFGAAVNQIAGAYASGKPAGNLDIGGAVTYDMPDFQSIAQQATAAALAHLSPTAAGLAGKPLPGVQQGVDIAGALNKSNYAPTTTISPDGTVTIQHQQSQPQPQPFAQSGLPEGRSLAPALPPMAPNEQQIFGNYVPS